MEKKICFSLLGLCLVKETHITIFGPTQGHFFRPKLKIYYKKHIFGAFLVLWGKHFASHF